MSARSDVFFDTKRKIVATIDHRLSLITSKYDPVFRPGWLAKMSESELVVVKELEELRNYIRNGMLWDTRPGRKRR
jgi:hypothetical protein